MSDDDFLAVVGGMAKTGVFVLSVWILTNVSTCMERTRIADGCRYGQGFTHTGGNGITQGFECKPVGSDDG